MSTEETTNTTVEETNLDNSQQVETKPAQKEERLFTQEEINGMLAKEKAQGRRAALAEIGVKNAAEAKKALEGFKQYTDSLKTDEEKQADYAAQILEIQAEAQRKADIAEAKVQAMILGAKTDCVEDVITLVMAKMSDGAELQTLVGEVKTKYPTLFNLPGDETATDKVGKRGTGGVVKNDAKKEGGEDKSIGARLGAQRRAMNKKSNYFSN